MPDKNSLFDFPINVKLVEKEPKEEKTNTPVYQQKVKGMLKYLKYLSNCK